MSFFPFYNRDGCCALLGLF